MYEILIDWAEIIIGKEFLDKSVVSSLIFPDNYNSENSKLGYIEVSSQDANTTHKHYFIGIIVISDQESEYRFLGNISFPKESDQNTFLDYLSTVLI
ncbi:hypothetical protein [Paenibacillus lautus]|uniref:hypothetical protein n=1 Tax=Paenibacillus lautus TaxID=1401 RepID=UPI001C7DCE6E|nr:hypothetical protein [Paenibacillus lautus]MBX4147496.1 hypothetical protein [Paenibacillus lautus]